jgi:hypothetical protein
MPAFGVISPGSATHIVVSIQNRGIRVIHITQRRENVKTFDRSAFPPTQPEVCRGEKEKRGRGESPFLPSSPPLLCRSRKTLSRPPKNVLTFNVETF